MVAHVDDRCIALFQDGGTTCFRRLGERSGPNGRSLPAEADLARRAGEEAIELLERREWPFVDDDPIWAACAPDPAWPLPTVPAEALVL